MEKVNNQRYHKQIIKWLDCWKEQKLSALHVRAKVSYARDLIFQATETNEKSNKFAANLVHFGIIDQYYQNMMAVLYHYENFIDYLLGVFQKELSLNRTIPNENFVFLIDSKSDSLCFELDAIIIRMRILFERNFGKRLADILSKETESLFRDLLNLVESEYLPKIKKYRDEILHINSIKPLEDVKRGKLQFSLHSSSAVVVYVSSSDITLFVPGAVDRDLLTLFEEVKQIVISFLEDMSGVLLHHFTSKFGNIKQAKKLVYDNYDGIEVSCQLSDFNEKYIPKSVEKK